MSNDKGLVLTESVPLFQDDIQLRRYLSSGTVLGSRNKIDTKRFYVWRPPGWDEGRD